MGLYLGSIRNVGLQMLHCIWFVGIKLILKGASQQIVHRYQTAGFDSQLKSFNLIKMGLI